MLNHIIVMGRLTRDPEIRYTQNQIPVVSFTVAVDRSYSSRDGGEKQTDFIDCVAWRNTAEFVQKYFTKGSMAIVSGRLQIRDWTDRDGNKRRSAEISAESVEFGESKRNRDESGSAPKSSNYNPYPSFDGGNQDTGPAFSDLSDADGELPF